MAKRKQNTPKSQKSTGWHPLRMIRSRRFWLLVLTAVILGVLIFFSETIGKATFQAFGLGIIVLGAWIATIILMVWQRRFNSVRENWNDWLGIVVLSIALWGILSFFRPSISIAGASMADGTLGGSWGLIIAGTTYAWARLTVMGLVGAILIFPERALILAKGLGRFGWQTIRKLSILTANGLKQLLRKIGVWLGLAFGFLKTEIASLFRSKPSSSKVPSNKKTAAESSHPEIADIEELLSEDVMADMEPEEELLEEEILLPDINRELPPIEILNQAPKAAFVQANDAERAKLIENAMASYGVEVTVKQINPGPSVTQFGVEPGWVRKYRRVPEKDSNGKPRLDKDGRPITHMEEISKTRVKVEKITSLASDLSLALAVPSDIRIEAPVPGKALVGIEVPNTSTAVVSLRSVIESPTFQKINSKSRLVMALGQGAGGEPVSGDLAKMPHLLIAGATGSGKTVCLNCIVTCLLAQTTPADVRMVLIDPKRVEMVTFAEVPHLLTPVIVDVDKAIEGLRRTTIEMDNRYREFASVGARNIEAYNRNPRVTRPMPYIVVIIDELADLMMTAADVVEPLICRLAQLSRATGIHLVVATQRPSVDVITGLIKANFPTRISFAVVSSIDSRTILDAIGAEKLLGKGDMLYTPPEASKPKRIRGCFVSDDEMDRLVKYWKEWASKHFLPENDRMAQEFAALSVSSVEADPFMEKARQILEETTRVSASLLQRKLHIGYNRAARIMEQLEQQGLLDGEETGRPWEGEP